MKNLKYKKINHLEQYNKYCDIHAELMISEEMTDEIELLELLIEDYDRRMITDTIEELNPVELLRSLLKDTGWSQSKFAEQIDVSRQLVNDILAYRRNISKELVIKFADFFSMSQEAFSRNYELKLNKNEVILIGYLESNPEIRRLDNGPIMSKLSLITIESEDQEGNKEKELHEIVVTRPDLTELVEKLTKGDLICVKGKLTHHKSVDKEGNNQNTTKVIAYSLEMLEDENISDNNSKNIHTKTDEVLSSIRPYASPTPLSVVNEPTSISIEEDAVVEKSIDDLSL